MLHNPVNKLYYSQLRLTSNVSSGNYTLYYRNHDIRFDHCGQDYQAIIYYNFKEIKDCFILKFQIGFNRPITFFKEKDAWGSDSELQIRFPDTYVNIQKSIVEAFKVKEGLDDFHFKEYSIDSTQWKV